MNQFKLNRITGALLAAGLVLPVGYAAAQTQQDPSVSATDRGPRQGATMFIGGGASAKARVTSTTSAAESTQGAHAVQLHCFAGTIANGTTSVTDSNAGTNAQTFLFATPFASACTGTNASDRIVAIYDTSGTGTDGDFIGGTVNQFAVVPVGGGALSTGGTDAASLAVIAAAANVNALAIRAGYAGPIITAASQGAANGAVSLTFNANLSGDAVGTGAITTSPSTNAAVIKTVNGNDISPVSLVHSTADTSILTLASDTASAGFTSAVNKAGVDTGDIFDTAGNAVTPQAVRSNFSNTTGVAFAPGTAKAIVTLNGLSEVQRVDAWNPTVSTNGVSAGGSVSIVLRMNEEVTGTFNTTTLSITPAMGAITAGPTVNDTDREISLVVPANMELGFNSSGQLVASTDNWATAATPVTIGFAANTTGSVSVAASGMAIATGGVAAVAVMAGENNRPTPADLTLDSNIDGFLDGYSLRSHGLFSGLAYTPAAPSFALNTAAGGSLSLINDFGTNTFASTVSVNSTIQVNVVLNNLTGVNDWNGDGATTGDAALYTLANFGTGLTDTRWSVRAAAVTATTAASGLNYSNIFRATDGEVLPVANEEANVDISTFVDNAPPVLVFTEYAEVNAQGEEANGQARDAFGDLKLVFSEAIEAPINLGSILINGTPVTLKNLNANIPSEVDSTIVTAASPFGGVGANQVTLGFVPNVFGQVVSFPAGSYATGQASHINETGTGAPDYLAVVNSVASANTAANAPIPNATITGARLRTTFVPGTKMDVVIVDYSEAVVANGGANLNGVFVVRALVGGLRGPAFQDRTDDAVWHEFIIPGANVAIGTAGVGGANSVTLTIPDNTATKGLPGDTQEIWVEYNPWGTNNVNRLNRASDGVPLPTGSGDSFNGVTLPAGDPVTEDGDTVQADIPAIFYAQFGNEASTQLMTQTVLGDLERNGVAIVDDIGIRADLIQVLDSGAGAVAPKEPLLRDGGGVITVRRGPNSEPANNDQTLALVNQAVLQADWSNYYRDLRNYNSALKSKVTDAGVTNLQRIEELLRPEIDALRKYDIIVTGSTGALTLANADGTIQAYVEVTTGAGALGSSGNNGSNQSNDQSPDVPGAQNSNAELGRTATLRRSIPNVQRNGTTYYPVQVDMESGQIFPIGPNNPVQSGQLPVVQGQLAGASAATTRRFKILDTAYAKSKNGNYVVTVGTTEAAFTNATGPLNPSVTGDVFVLISVRDPATGNYIPVTSGDPSFVKHVKFVPDLKGNGKPTKFDVDLAEIAIVDVQNVNGWQMLGILGELDRNASLPLDPRAWLSVQEDNGDPVTNFAFDNGTKDEAFILGTDAAVANAVKVAFEGANNTLVNNLRPSKAAGIAFNANALAKAAKANGADGVMDDTAAAWTPTTGAVRVGGVPRLYLPIKPGVATLPKLLKNSWHLVTVQSTTRTFVTLPSQVDAAIIVGPSGAVAWFRGEEATQHLNTVAIEQGTALFLHVGSSDVPANTPL